MNLIKSKRTLRYYAPYQSASGTWRLKGFATRQAAARFLAKQLLFDHVFGSKQEKFVQTAVDDGYSIYTRSVPEPKEDRIAKFAEKFPLEECMHVGSGYWSCPCTFDCERLGYARCLANQFMKDAADKFLAGRIPESCTWDIPDNERGEA